jgi:DNA-directed RNA polymerase specialized sigma24 family protein
MNSDLTSETPSAGRGSFPTTHWSMVVNAGADSTRVAQEALESLCRSYWYPLYSHVRRQGRSHHEAEDCTQEFFSRLLAADGVARARPERGKFRSFLLTSLRNFLHKEWRRSQAEKRGGGQPLFGLDLDQADERFTREPADPGLTPEGMFDRNWALGLIEGAVATLRAEYEKDGRGGIFAILTPLLWGNAGSESLAEHAAHAGMTTQNFTMALHRLRQRFGQRLRAAVAETVAEEADVELELRHLIAALGNAAPGR